MLFLSASLSVTRKTTACRTRHRSRKCQHLLSVLSQGPSVIGVHDDERVICPAELFELVRHPAELRVHPGDRRHVEQPPLPCNRRVGRHVRAGLRRRTVVRDWRDALVHRRVGRDRDLRHLPRACSAAASKQIVTSIAWDWSTVQLHRSHLGRATGTAPGTGRPGGAS
eukprot:SAG22_NODE_104_length_20159_cov_5.877517_19_plen_168_part_00